MRKKPNLKKLKIEQITYEDRIKFCLVQGKYQVPLFDITSDGLLDFTYFYKGQGLNKLGIQTVETEFGPVPEMIGIPMSVEQDKKLTQLVNFVEDLRDVFRGESYD